MNNHGSADSARNPVAVQHVIGKWWSDTQRQERVMTARGNARGAQSNNSSGPVSLNSTCAPVVLPDANEPHPTLYVKQVEEETNVSEGSPWIGTFEQVLERKFELQQLAVEKLFAHQLVQFRDCLALELKQQGMQLSQELDTTMAQRLDEFTATLDLHLRRSDPNSVSALTAVSGGRGTPSGDGMLNFKTPALGESPSPDRLSSCTRVPSLRHEDSKHLGREPERERLLLHVQRMGEAERRGDVQYLLKDMGCCQRVNFDAIRQPHRPLVKVIDSTLFTYITLLVIISNGVWIGYSTDEGLKECLVGREVPEYHKRVNRVYFVLFSLELLFRIFALRSSWLLRRDWGWNLYDAVVVCASALEELASTLNLQFLRVLRVIRVVRVVRVFRVLRFFAGLRHHIMSVINCAWVLVWACAFMMFEIYIFAIVFCQGILNESEQKNASDLKKHFGSVANTMYTLLLGVSFGIPWGELADNIALISPVFRVLFSFYVVFTVFGVLNVVTGVFVEKTASMKDHDRDLAVHHEMTKTNSFVKELKALLEEHGIKEQRQLDWYTFSEFMAHTDVEMYMQTHGIDSAEANDIFKLLDYGGQGSVSINDFVYGCQRLKGLAKEMDIVLLAEQLGELGNKLVEFKTRMDSNHRHVDAFMQKMMHQISESRVDLFCVQEALPACGSSMAKVL